MKLKELLVQIYEGHCERLPDETDEDYRRKYKEKNLAWYHKTKAKKAAAAAAAVAAPEIQ